MDLEGELVPQGVWVREIGLVRYAKEWHADDADAPQRGFTRIFKTRSAVAFCPVVRLTIRLNKANNITSTCYHFSEKPPEEQIFFSHQHSGVYPGNIERDPDPVVCIQRTELRPLQ